MLLLKILFFKFIILEWNQVMKFNPINDAIGILITYDYDDNTVYRTIYTNDYDDNIYNYFISAQCFLRFSLDSQGACKKVCDLFS